MFDNWVSIPLHNTEHNIREISITAASVSGVRALTIPYRWAIIT